MEGTYTGIRYVHATGDIEARVWYSKSIEIDYSTTEKVETGNIENKYSIKFEKFQINLYKSLSNFEIYDTIEEENKLKLLTDFYLPVSIIKTQNIEVVNIEKTYTVEEAKSLGVKELEQQFNEELEINDANNSCLLEIVNKNINVYENEESVEIVMTYEVIENIGIDETFEIIEEQIEEPILE